MISLLPYRLAAILSAILIFSAACIGIAHHFKAAGRADADREWLAKMASVRAAYEQKDAADQLHYQQIERNTSEHHEQELAQLRIDRDADRAAVDHAGGLRISAPTCPAAGPAAGPEAAGASGRNETSPATVRLPQPVEDGLWRLADDADEVSAQLRACQGWIRSNNFYGTATDSNSQLLDKIAGDNNSSGATP
jgi:hypothetical protein